MFNEIYIVLIYWGFTCWYCKITGARNVTKKFNKKCVQKCVAVKGCQLLN